MCILRLAPGDQAAFTRGTGEIQRPQCQESRAGRRWWDGRERASPQVLLSSQQGPQLGEGSLTELPRERSRTDSECGRRNSWQGSATLQD